MKTTIKLFSTGLLISQLLMTSCKGPTGDPGPKGADGEKGDVGAQGVAGATGTANVIYGNWIDMNVAGYWYKLNSANVTVYSGHGWGSDFAAPVTQDILDKGLILVYGKFDNSNSDKRVYLLPNDWWGKWSTQVSATLNRIYIYTIYNDTLPIPNTYSPNGFLSQFRYVIIPGSKAGRKAAIDYTDYNAVKEYYHLKD